MSISISRAVLLIQQLPQHIVVYIYLCRTFTVQQLMMHSLGEGIFPKPVNSHIHILKGIVQ